MGRKQGNRSDETGAGSEPSARISATRNLDDATARPRTIAAPTSALGPSAGRGRLRRMVGADAPPTAPMSLVDRLAGSPYANPLIQVGDAEKQARSIVDFTVLLAETMFRFGAGALEVETSMIAVTAAFGLRDIEVDITNQSVSINYAPKNGAPLTLQRVVRSWTKHYAGLALVHQLVTEIVAGTVEQAEAHRRLKAILTRPKPYPRWAVGLASAGVAGAVVGVLGGGLWGACVAALTAVLVSWVSRFLRRWHVPDFFITAIATFIVTIVALTAWMIHAPIAPAAIVTGGILTMLPTGRLISGAQDAINGFPVTAAGRFLSTSLTFGALTTGIALASAVGVKLGVDTQATVSAVGDATPPLAGVLVLILLGTAFNGIAEQTAPRLLLPTALIGVLGYMMQLGVESLGFGSRIAPAIGAVLVGTVSRLVALRLGAPQLVVAVPATLFLLTGLAIFRSMFELIVADDMSMPGFFGLFNAVATVLGVAAGVVFGDTLARPFNRQSSHEGRRDRRS